MWVGEAGDADANRNIDELWCVYRECKAKNKTDDEQWMRVVIADNFGTKPKNSGEPENIHDGWSAVAREEKKSG